MKKKGSIILTLLFVFFSCVQTLAQKKTYPDVTVNLDSASLEQFVLAIETQTPLHFYYDTTQADSITITLHVQQQPLFKVLDQALSNTGLRYTITEEGYAFLLKDKNIETAFAPFNTDEKNGRGVDLNGLQKRDKDNIKTTLENKVYDIGDKLAPTAAPNAIIAGTITDAKTGEPVVGAYLQADQTGPSLVTDQYGYFSFSLPRGRHVINIQSLGMKDTRRQVHLYNDGKLNIDMQSTILTIKNVVISSQKLNNVRSVQMGLQKIDIKTIKQVPVIFGEADILRVVTTLPGVKTVGEASTGLNVRGGSTDQNLILFNDATIYNPSHFFGMFSAFNPEVVKDVELYKSSIPARYGGRLSSVLNINGREGNKKQLTGSAGIGLLTSRFNLEGPLIKDKTSFILGARSTYANWLLNLLPDQYKNSKAGFYDLNLSITHELDKKNTLYFTGYYSKDRFNLNSDTTYGYKNQNFSVKWKHVFNNKLNSVVTGGTDEYTYNIGSSILPLSAYKMGFDIHQTYFKTHFNYYLDNRHTIDFGFNSIYYKLNPGYFNPDGKNSLVSPDQVEREKALESAIYLNDKYNITSAFTLEGGIRFSFYQFLGPKTVNTYAEGLPVTTDNQTGSKFYDKGKIIKTYAAPEYRLSARYAFTPSFSLKAAFNTQRQYIHMLSNTASMAPTDIWKLSDVSIRPQQGGQLSFGLYKNSKANTIETSLEVYYKKISNYLDYKSGGNLVMNHHLETDVIGTKGKAYGVEFLVKKLTGKINGWFSYTWSRVLLKQDDLAAGELINKGNFYPANYDKPHDVTLIGNYRVNHRFSLSLNATYSTGRPITLPVGVFYFAGSNRTLYADRNEFRIPDYFRADFSMNIDGNHKVHQVTHNSWTLGVYNLTGRKNPYSVYYVSENGAVNGYKLSIFGSAIPFINFNIRF
ncbi:MAG: TonB-dependent receptor [Ferruginibacter sp.]|uniref:TonB-dependent receptor n=1 Tax=Ferruginibacter sp. TaxID=1940288 RepID=UPI0026588737|nr:TonB-dependent receptor [Ferruginibacter sp.]MDB5277435.1 TonB-dependent receptor [Ferruginibacter sp.]